jgi:hypothetical protein
MGPIGNGYLEVGPKLVRRKPITAYAQTQLKLGCFRFAQLSISHDLLANILHLQPHQQKQKFDGNLIALIFTTLFECSD